MVRLGDRSTANGEWSTSCSPGLLECPRVKRKDGLDEWHSFQIRSLLSVQIGVVSRSTLWIPLPRASLLPIRVRSLQNWAWVTLSFPRSSSVADRGLLRLRNSTTAEPN